MGKTTRAVSLRDRLRILWRRKIKPLVHAVLASNDSPQQIAWGVALGSFLAFTPTIGFQTITALFLATVFRLSRIPCAVMVYITNPVTAAPIYYSCYVLGRWVLGLMGIEVGDLWDPFVAELGGLKDYGLWEATWEGLRIVARFGLKVAGPLTLGCLIEGLVAAAIAYPLTLRLVEGHRVLRAERAARRLRGRAHEHDDDDAPEPSSAPRAEAPEEAPPPSHAPPAEQQTAKEAGHGSADTPTGERTRTDPLDSSPDAATGGGDRRAG